MSETDEEPELFRGLAMQSLRTFRETATNLIERVDAEIARRSRVQNEPHVLCPWCMEQVELNHGQNIGKDSGFAAHVQACSAVPESVKAMYTIDRYPPLVKQPDDA